MCKNVPIKLWLYTNPHNCRPMLIFSKTKRRAVTLLKDIGIEKEDAERHLFRITDIFNQENVIFLPII